MKQRFYIYQRRGTFYLQDSRTGKQQSLETKDKQAALRILEVKRQTDANPGFDQFILKACLNTRDPILTTRTWQTVMEQMQTHGKESTKTRCARAMKSKAFNSLRNVKLVETTAEDFLTILNGGKVSVAHYLKRLHNLALGLGWLAFPVLAPRLWPKLHFKSKRGITLAEHKRILAAEKNPERNLYYQLLWEIGSSQSDAAMLNAENIDRQTRSLTYPGQWAAFVDGKYRGHSAQKEILRKKYPDSARTLIKKITMKLEGPLMMGGDVIVLDGPAR